MKTRTLILFMVLSGFLGLTNLLNSLLSKHDVSPPASATIKDSANVELHLPPQIQTPTKDQPWEQPRADGWLTVTQVARREGVHRDTVYRWFQVWTNAPQTAGLIRRRDPENPRSHWRVHPDYRNHLP